MFGKAPGSYLISCVNENEFRALMTLNSTNEDKKKSDGLQLLYEIPPELNPSLPDSNSKHDGFYNISDEWTMCQLELT